MNAISLLEKQHRKVEQILKRLQNAKSGQEDLVTELATNLTAHSRIEEEIFYPACREVLKGKDSIILESYEEHAVVVLELDRLIKSKVSGEMFKARAKVIKDLVTHHIDEEEEQLLPKIQKMMDEDTLDQLGDEMKALFDETVEEGYEKALQQEKRQSASKSFGQISANGSRR